MTKIIDFKDFEKEFLNLTSEFAAFINKRNINIKQRDLSPNIDYLDSTSIKAPPPPAQHAGEFLPNSDTKLAQQNSFNISKNKMLKLNKFHRNYRYRHVIYYKFYLKLIYRKISFKFTQFRHFISKR